MEVKKFVIGAIIGSVVGLLSGWEGISGSTFIQAGLLLSGIVSTQSKAAGTTLLAMVFPISALAVWEYYKRGDVDVWLAVVITLFYMILAWLGAKLNAMVPPSITYFVTGVTLMFATGIFFYKAYSPQKIN